MGCSLPTLFCVLASAIISVWNRFSLVVLCYFTSSSIHTALLNKTLLYLVAFLRIFCVHYKLRWRDFSSSGNLNCLMSFFVLMKTFFESDSKQLEQCIFPRMFIKPDSHSWDKHNTSEISISASTRKKAHVSFSCAYVCAMLISQVWTRL